MTGALYKHIQVEIFPQAALVALRDSHLVDEIVIDAISAEVFQFLRDQKQNRVVLDFSQVEFLSSSFLGTLFKLRDHLGGDASGLRLSSINADLQRLFKLFPKHSFQIHATARDALKAY